MDPKLLKSNGVVKTYHIEDEIWFEEFTKRVTHYVDFSEEDTVAKCSCGLFQMRGILCRHILVVFKCNEIKFVSERYILELWRKDIKMRYTLIYNSFDARDQQANANRCSSLLNICYKMVTLAAGSDKHNVDATGKLFAMIDLYSDNQESPSMTVTGSNVGCTEKDTTIGGSSQKVLSPLAVRGKGRPSLLRKASGMEKHMRKVQAKTKKTAVKGKHKQRGGGDTPAMATSRNLFATSQSMQYGLDDSQPVQYGMDQPSPVQFGVDETELTVIK
ncbi:hypothetical protein F2P56_036003 [Juglans regia]|uniref:Protein FAR1-RELATED SEQUENCE n=1 Tax=Juglans regia TaxID=51240 RepID=A0A833TV18_JUGRE|nr:hypothetical protein F2P56_036003 [Juglans regia]